MVVGITDIAASAEEALGDPDVLALITEGLRRQERIEIVRTVSIPKKHGIARHKIDHDLDTLLWCGPAAVAALTGASTSEIRELIRDYREDGEARVDGTVDPEIAYVFDQLGYDMRLVYFCHAPMYKMAPTFARWLRDMPRESHVGYLVGQRADGRKAGHWCVVAGDWYLCSYSKAVWLPLDEAPRRRARIQSAYAISKR